MVATGLFEDAGELEPTSPLAVHPLAATTASVTTAAAAPGGSHHARGISTAFPSGLACRPIAVQASRLVSGRAAHPGGRGYQRREYHGNRGAADARRAGDRIDIAGECTGQLTDHDRTFRNTAGGGAGRASLEHH